MALWICWIQLLNVWLMVRQNPYLLTALCIAVIVASCSKHEADYGLAFNDIRLIDSFPRSLHLTDADTLAVECLGMNSIKAVDSLLIVGTSETNGAWWVLRLPDLSVKSRLMDAGQGPEEFTFVPECGYTEFYAEDNRTVFWAADPVRQSLLRVDLTASIDSGRMIAERHDAEMLDRTTMLSIGIQSGRLFTLSAKPETGQLIRRYIVDGQAVSTSNLAKLNDCAVEDMQYFNMLFQFLCVNGKMERMVEAPAKLHQINLYDLNGTFARTLVVGRDKPDDYRLLAGNSVSDVHLGIRSLPTCFGVITPQSEDEVSPCSIQFFDWDGNPIVEVVTDSRFQVFDIDIHNGVLYVLDYQNDQLKSYDAHHLLPLLFQQPSTKPSIKQ